MIEDQADAMPDLGPEPWLRLPRGKGKGGRSETPKAFAIFQHYLHSDPAGRSLRKTADACRKSRSQLDRWSPVFWWAERAAEWDLKQAQLAAAQHEQQQQERQRLEQEREQLRLKRIEEIKEKKWATAEELHEIGMRMIRQPLYERQVQKTDGSGSQITVKPNSRTHEVGRRIVETSFGLTDQSVTPDPRSATPGQSYSDVYEPADYKSEKPL